MDIKLTRNDLLKKFDEQLELLIILSDTYDDGNNIIAKSMATTIRVLVHDTNSSISLLTQLNKKNGKFYDSTVDINNIKNNGGKIIGSFSNLANIGIEGKYIPMLDDPITPEGFVDFDNYWNKVVILDKDRNEHTRKDLVLNISNKDGGAHVDSKVSQKYYDLIKQNSLGITVKKGESEKVLENIELASVRQIAHEILRTFNPKYPYKKNLTKDVVIGSLMIFSDSQSTSLNKNKIPPSRNDQCPCASGKKYKKCHGNVANTCNIF